MGFVKHNKTEIPSQNLSYLIFGFLLIFSCLKDQVHQLFDIRLNRFRSQK